MLDDFEPNSYGDTWEEYAQFFIDYFRHADEHYPNDELKLGLKVAEQWLSLIKNQGSSDQVVALLQTIKENRTYGSGWYDLSVHYFSWIKESKDLLSLLDDSEMNGFY
jgi:hypothetical protein